MTYKEMTRRIEHVGKQIEFVYEIQKAEPSDDRKRMCGDIVNSLLAYKNYLYYEKNYKENV